MKKNNFMRLGAFVFLFAHVGTAWSQDAWWSFCDTCISDSSFRNHTTQVEVEGTIYVSNLSTNQTRKLERWVTYEDFSDGVVRMTHVYEVSMSNSEKAVFNDIIETANTGFVVVPRDALVDFGAQDRGSALDDFAGGYLSGNFIRGLFGYLVSQGYFPDAYDASERLGFEIQGLGYQADASVSHGARSKPLGARVDYPDGSSIGLTYSTDGERVTDITVTDAEGEEVQIIGQDSDGNTVLNVDDFVNRQFIFGANDHSILRLFDWVGQQFNDVSCSARMLNDDHMVVTCQVKR